jgi:ElaB/YqjD/DUF883 family membrane-anchored ribosome-binding protein
MMATLTRKHKVLNKNTLTNHLHNIKEALSETSDGITDRAHELVANLIEDLNARKSDFIDGVEDFVDAKPLKALGIALLVGYVVSKVIL